MSNRKLTKSVTMSLVALAAATGAAVFEAAGATADTTGPSVDSISTDPGQDLNVPGLTKPGIKIEGIFPDLQLPALTVPTIKIAKKVPAQKIPSIIFSDIKGESLDPKH